MSGLLKCFVLSCVVPAIFGYMDVRDDVSWFKNGQRIKNKFVTGVVNGIVDFDCIDTVEGSNIEGECLSAVECKKSGGKTGGLCSLLGSCCVIEKTCGETTSSKISYFVPPKTFQTDCKLTVNIYSKDVCQISFTQRTAIVEKGETLGLDFERFDIAKPTNRKIQEQDPPQYSSYQCHDDSFTVTNVERNLGFPHLCGKNKGQHIYVPVGESTQNIQLNFALKNRNGTNMTLPDWRIKIRQLECKKSGYHHLLSGPTKLMAMYNTLKNKKKSKSDWELIAPPHCLQYYPATSGTFESFNYDEGRGCYIGNLDYAICFRKTPEVCGARYTASGRFQMNYNPYKENMRDRCHPPKPASHEVSQDYIRIPGGMNSANLYKDHYCDADLENKGTVVAKSREPLYVGVHTDGFRANMETTGEEDVDDFEEIGFRISYTLESGRCDVSY